AATALISALNALTLKPTQCALYLRPVAKDKRANWLYRGFNRIYGVVEHGYMGGVRWMVRRPRTMVGIFFIIVGLAGAAFASYPTALVPLEDQGYCIVTARLPVGASQPRVRQVAADIDTVLKDIPGIKGWVTIGGYSALDSAKLANVVTAFVMYQNWDQRPPGFSQAQFLPKLQQKLLSIRNAQIAVLPPSPIPGLGNAFGFQMVIEDRASAGLGRLQQAVQHVLGIAQNRPGFLRIGFTTFNANSPQLYLDIDRTMANSFEVSVNDVSQTLQTYLGSTYVNLFNKFNQSFQVRVQAAADYRRQLDAISKLAVANQSGQMVPLGACSMCARCSGPSSSRAITCIP